MIVCYTYEATQLPQLRTHDLLLLGIIVFVVVRKREREGSDIERKESGRRTEEDKRRQRNN